MVLLLQGKAPEREEAGLFVLGCFFLCPTATAETQQENAGQLSLTHTHTLGHSHTGAPSPAAPPQLQRRTLLPANAPPLLIPPGAGRQKKPPTDLASVPSRGVTRV